MGTPRRLLPIILTHDLLRAPPRPAGRAWDLDLSLDHGPSALVHCTLPFLPAGLSLVLACPRVGPFSPQLTAGTAVGQARLQTEDEFPNAAWPPAGPAQAC